MTTAVITRLQTLSDQEIVTLIDHWSKGLSYECGQFDGHGQSGMARMRRVIAEAALEAARRIDELGRDLMHIADQEDDERRAAIAAAEAEAKEKGIAPSGPAPGSAFDPNVATEYSAIIEPERHDDGQAQQAQAA